jgi:ABC-type maltose transport system permease subunit
MRVLRAEGIVEAPPKSAAQRLARALSGGPLHVFLILLGLFWLTPAVGLFVSSFRSVADYAESGWWTVFSYPRALSLEPYQEILANEAFVTAAFNTVKISVPASILVVLVAAMAAYAFAWIDFRGRDYAFLTVVALLVVPLQMALIPVARLFNPIGIFGTVWAAILFHIAFGLPFAIFLLRNFFIGIPADLLEAARIDGASEVQIFTRLMLLVDLERPFGCSDLRQPGAIGAVDRIYSKPDAPVRNQHRHHRSGSFLVHGRTSAGVLRFPALLCPGPLGRLGQVSRASTRPVSRRHLTARRSVTE